MSRYCADMDSAPALRAAEHWRAEALRKDGSVFSDRSLWCSQHLEAVEEYFVNRLDEREATFLDKLKDQLAPTTPETKQLVAEMMWVMFLCPSSLTVEKKREDVQLVWSWSGQALSPDSDWLSTRVLRGIGSAGQSFNYNRWRELSFFVRFMLAFKKLDTAERERLISDSWGFAHYGSRTLHSENLYQLLSYLVNAQDRGENVEGLLLYPTVNRSVKLSYCIFGIPVRVETIDLARPWQSIYEDLKQLPN